MQTAAERRDAAAEVLAGWRATAGAELSTRTAQLPLFDLRAALRAIDHCERWATAYPACGRPDVTGPTLRAATLASVERALVTP